MQHCSCLNYTYLRDNAPLPSLSLSRCKKLKAGFIFQQCWLATQLGWHSGAPPIPPLQQHVSQKENSGNIKFYESFTQIATLLPINASTGPGAASVKGRAASACLPPTTLTPLLPAPALLLPSLFAAPATLFFVSVVPFRLQFLYCCKMFSFQRSYIYFANTHTHKKVVCSPFNSAAPSSPPLQPLACLLQAFSTALPCPAPSCRHCSLRLCRLY